MRFFKSAIQFLAVLALSAINWIVITVGALFVGGLLLKSGNWEDRAFADRVVALGSVYLGAFLASLLIGLARSLPYARLAGPLGCAIPLVLFWFLNRSNAKVAADFGGLIWMIVAPTLLALLGAHLGVRWRPGGE